MTKLRSRCVQVAGVLVLVACTSPTPTPPPSVDATPATEVLCDPTDAASLSRLADELDRLDGSPPPEALGDKLRQTRERLEPLSLGPDATSVRDSAVAALGDLEAAVGEAGDSSESATIAGQTMRELETLICPAPPI